MLNKVIEGLKGIDSPVSKKLFDIFTKNQSVVGDDFYSSTIFKEEGNYNKNKTMISGKIFGTFQKKIVETPLVFIRGKELPIFFSADDQGIDFGFTMVDYITSKPLLVVTLLFDKLGVKYESIMFDVKTSTYISSTVVNKVCDDINDLVSFIIENANNDIDKWVSK